MPPYNKALPTPTLTLPNTLFSTFWLFPSFPLKINAFTMRDEIWKGRKKSLAKGRIKPGSIATMTRDLPSALLELMFQLTLLFFWFFQQWVIYSQTNAAVSNYTYLFRFVWFVVVFSDLFCFRICHCVFWLVIMFSELLLCFLNYFVV